MKYENGYPRIQIVIKVIGPSENREKNSPPFLILKSLIRAENMNTMIAVRM